MTMKVKGKPTGSETHKKMLELYVNNYIPQEEDAYLIYENEVLFGIPKTIRIDLNISCKEKITWVEAETDFDKIYFKVCRMGYAFAHVFKDLDRFIETDEEYTSLFNESPDKIVFIIPKKGDYENNWSGPKKEIFRKLLVEFLAEVIKLGTMHFNIELLVADIENDQIFNF